MIDLHQTLTRHTRAYIKGMTCDPVKKALAQHRWHPYSYIPKKLKFEDVTRNKELVRDRDKDGWRANLNIYASSTREMIRKSDKESFVPKMAAAVWNDKKIKTKEMLV